MSPRPSIRALATAAAFAIVAVPVCAHAWKARRDERATLEKMRALTAELAPIARKAKLGRRLILNGQPTLFGLRTEAGGIEHALEGVAGECARGDLGVRLEPAATRDGDDRVPETLELTRVQNEIAADGTGLSLCIFRAPAAAGPEEARRRVRYTLAERTDDGRTSLMTVATESTRPIDELFPRDADVPGGELPGVPRPKDARRAFAADVEGERYAVRVYETTTAVSEAVRSYDAVMASAGWVRSEAVARELDAARAYAKNGVEVVAAFHVADGVTTVAVAPLTDD